MVEKILAFSEGVHCAKVQAHVTMATSQLAVILHIHPSLKQGSQWRISVFPIINIAAA